MTLQEVNEAMAATGLPVTYDAWPKNAAPPLPWICISAGQTNNFGADGIVYLKIQHVRIELYSELVSLEDEEKIENALYDSGLFWNSTREYLEDEQCYETVYEIEV